MASEASGLPVRKIKRVRGWVALGAAERVHAVEQRHRNIHHGYFRFQALQSGEQRAAVGAAARRSRIPAPDIRHKPSRMISWSSARMMRCLIVPFGSQRYFHREPGSGVQGRIDDHRSSDIARPFLDTQEAQARAGFGLTSVESLAIIDDEQRQTTADPRRPRRRWRRLRRSAPPHSAETPEQCGTAPPLSRAGFQRALRAP